MYLFGSVPYPCGPNQSELNSCLPLFCFICSQYGLNLHSFLFLLFCSFSATLSFRLKIHSSTILPSHSESFMSVAKRSRRGEGAQENKSETEYFFSDICRSVDILSILFNRIRLDMFFWFCNKINLTT